MFVQGTRLDKVLVSGAYCYWFCWEGIERVGEIDYKFLGSTLNSSADNTVVGGGRG